MAGGRDRPIIEIMTNRTTDGNSDEFQTNQMSKVLAFGTWDSAVLTLQVNPYDGDATWITSATDTLTESDNTGIFIDDITASKLRFVLSSAGAGTDLSIIVLQVATPDPSSD